MIRTSTITRARTTTLALSLILAAAVAVFVAAGFAHAVPTTFLVINTNDSGAGSLRQAITDANANANPAETDTVSFLIPATDPNCDATTGVCTISPATALPEIVETLTINGYSQRGASPNTLVVGNDAQLKIEVSGAGAGDGANGIVIAGPDDSVVSGLIINRWDGAGAVVGRLSSGDSASGNRLEGNYVGTDAAGTEDLGNNDGVVLSSGDTVVGGTTPAARNVISGNDSSGVVVQGIRSGFNRIEGNYVGTDKNGAAELENINGVSLRGSTSGNVVGGTVDGARNVVSGNGNGIEIDDSNGNVIEGNYVGTDATGTSRLRNVTGVSITGGENNVVGGTVAAARNVISGNLDGVLLTGAFTSGNRIEGNYIGPDKNGTTGDSSFQDGVTIEDGPSNNVVGGTAPGARNLISGNSTGVEVADFDASAVPTTGNRILRNSIFDNLGLGINLRDQGLTQDENANDPGDADTGPNNLQNYPVITSATTSGGQTTIQGGLNSSPNDTFNLQFFSSPQGDPSGFGEGETFVGQTNVTTNANGNVTFGFTTGATVAGGRVVAATATNINTEDTSEFSRAVEVEDGTPPPPQPQCSDGADNDADGQTDFPNDPDCASAAENSESPDAPAGCTIIGTNGDDSLGGTSGNDTVCGLGGNDTINAGSGDDTVKGGEGNDTINGDSGNDTLEGEGGDDTAWGGAGDDNLSGGDGSDKLFGEAGNDSLAARDGVRANDRADGGVGRDSCLADKKDKKARCER